MPSIHGVYTVLITPFNKHGILDEEGLRLLIRRQIEACVEGVVCLGTTGECPTLTEQEQRRVMTICREETQGRMALIVGTGSYSTAHTIESTQQAQDLRADAALIVTPYYNKPTQEGLYLHYKAIAEAVDLPIIIYNVHYRTCQNLQTDTLKRLIDIPSIVGVKEASGNISQISDVIELARNARPDFSVMSGDDNMTLPVMALGGHGILSVASNLVPDKIKELVDAAACGDFESARNHHYQLAPLFKAMFIETNPIPIKAAMQLGGLPSGNCRLPLCQLSPENARTLECVVKTYTDIPIPINI